MTAESLEEILANKGLAQLGDSLLNFAYSAMLTEKSGEPQGTKVQDKVLAAAAVKAGLRKHMRRRVDRGEVANGLEALLAYTWTKKLITLEEITACLAHDTDTTSDSFARLAEIALAKTSMK